MRYAGLAHSTVADYREWDKKTAWPVGPCPGLGTVWWSATLVTQQGV